jgi:8-oxo-dGTP diphosphatase
MMNKITRVSAYGIINDGERRILLCRLSPIVEHLAGKWTLPGGGIDFGEDPVDAVVREVKEETGLRVSFVGNLLDVDSVVTKFSDKEVHAVRIIYEAAVIDGEIVVEKHGSTDAVAWFSYEEAMKLPLVSLGVKGLTLWKRDEV